MDRAFSSQMLQATPDIVPEPFDTACLQGYVFNHFKKSDIVDYVGNYETGDLGDSAGTLQPFNSPGDWNQLDFKTGVRAFSPSFAGDHLRAYTNLDMGYVLGLAKGPFVSSAFGLTWGAGIQYNEKWSLGYTLQYETAGKSKNHFATIAYTF